MVRNENKNVLKSWENFYKQPQSLETDKLLTLCLGHNKNSTVLKSFIIGGTIESHRL